MWCGVDFPWQLTRYSETWECNGCWATEGEKHTCVQDTHPLSEMCRMAGWYTGGIWLRRGGWMIALVSVASRPGIHQQQLRWRRPWMLSLCLAPSSATGVALYSSLLPKHWLSQGIEAGWHPLGGSFRTLVLSPLQWTLFFAYCEYELQRSSLFVFSPIHAPFPTLLSPGLQGPLQSSQDMSHCPWVCVSSEAVFSCSQKIWITRGTGQSAAHWTGFPFTAVGSPLKEILQGLPWAGLWSMVLAPTYSANAPALVHGCDFIQRFVFLWAGQYRLWAHW